MDTVWVLGDQLNRDLNHLRDTTGDDTRVLMVVSRAKLRSKRWHRQRLHLYLTSMHRFAGELRSAGYDVDLREAATFSDGLDAHVAEHAPDVVRVMEPASRSGLALLRRLDVELVPSDQFLLHRDEFAAYADDHAREDGSLLLEDFYRWQRRRLDLLMDGDDPQGGAWNYDEENREPPPGDDHEWYETPTSPLDDLDHHVMERIEAMDGVELFGDPPDGTWPTSRRRAWTRFNRFLDEALPEFGPYEDAVVHDHWHLHHSLLSPALNLSLLRPLEVVHRIVERYEQDDVRLSSVEGIVRQVIGWREYVHGLYWWFDDDYPQRNFLGAHRSLPPVFTDPEVGTDMHCASTVLGWVSSYGWTHHIPRLMVIANLATLAGIEPRELMDWMWRSFVDGAEWVMVANVIGMGTFADGGAMSTKPYVSGGNYLDTMTDLCDGCRFDPSARVGEDACPFTTLYWDFLDRHREVLAGNFRMARTYATLDRLSDLDEVRTRADSVLSQLSAGSL